MKEEDLIEKKDRKYYKVIKHLIQIIELRLKSVININITLLAGRTLLRQWSRQFRSRSF